MLVHRMGSKECPTLTCSSVSLETLFRSLPGTFFLAHTVRMSATDVCVLQRETEHS